MERTLVRKNLEEKEGTKTSWQWDLREWRKGGARSRGERSLEIVQEARAPTEGHVFAHSLLL